MLVRVGAVGVCGSDLLRFGKGTAYHYPLVLGHEFSAVVEQAPAGQPFRPGRPGRGVPAAARTRPTRSPRSASRRWAAATTTSAPAGTAAWPSCCGCPEAQSVPVPAAMPLLHAAMVEPAAVALHAVLKLRVPADGIGAGDRRRPDRRAGRAVAAHPGLDQGAGRRRRPAQAGRDGRARLRDHRRRHRHGRAGAGPRPDRAWTPRSRPAGCRPPCCRPSRPPHPGPGADPGRPEGRRDHPAGADLLADPPRADRARHLELQDHPGRPQRMGHGGRAHRGGPAAGRPVDQPRAAAGRGAGRPSPTWPSGGSGRTRCCSRSPRRRRPKPRPAVVPAVVANARRHCKGLCRRRCA